MSDFMAIKIPSTHLTFSIGDVITARIEGMYGREDREVPGRVETIRFPQTGDSVFCEIRLRVAYGDGFTSKDLFPDRPYVFAKEI